MIVSGSNPECPNCGDTLDHWFGEFKFQHWFTLRCGECGLEFEARVMLSEPEGGVVEPEYHSRFVCT